MTQLQLPPRGILVSPRMIYYPQLPPSVILTWIQLRGLAWGGTVTPPLCMQELAEVTGRVRRRYIITSFFSGKYSAYIGALLVMVALSYFSVRHHPK